MVMPAPPRRRRTGMLVTGIVLLGAALLAGIVAGSHLVTGAFDVDELTVPVRTRLTLDAGDYDVLQRAGTRSGDASTFDQSLSSGLTPEGVVVTAPDGTTLDVFAPSGTNTLEVDGVSYVSFAVVTVPADGTYAVTVGGPPGAVVAVEPALGSILRRALPWVGVGLAAGLAGVVGLVLTIVGAVGRRTTAAG